MLLLPGILWAPAMSQQWHRFSLHTQQGIFSGGISSSPWRPTYRDCPRSYPYILNAQRQATKQHIPFLKYLVRLGRSLNRRHLRLRADAQTESGYCSKTLTYLNDKVLNVIGRGEKFVLRLSATFKI